MTIQLPHGVKEIHISRNCASKFEFGCFPRLVIRSTVLSPDAGQTQPQLPISQVSPRVGNLHTDIPSAPSQPLRLSLSVQYSASYMTQSIPYYKIGFVLDDFGNYRLLEVF